MNRRQIRKRYRQAARINRNRFYAYALACKLNQQCAGCSSDYHFRKNNLKRCLKYHKWCLKHKKKLTDLYYGIQNRNKRRYSPELVYNAMDEYKEKHNLQEYRGEREYIKDGENIVYAQSATIPFTATPRFEMNDDGSMKLVSFGLVKEDNNEPKTTEKAD